MMPDDFPLKSRRQFLKGAGIAGLATTFAGAHAVASNPGTKPGRKPKAKNLIFLVVDGMSVGTMGLAHHWHLRNRKKALNWTQLYAHPGLRRCVQDTASNNSPVTDSAAAASAWGCGQRVNNAALNMDPGGKPCTPIFARAKIAGMRTGLVSTCRISHATPAGFVANVASRADEDAIVDQYLSRQVDVLLGGGAKHFQRTKAGAAGTDYFKAFEQAGYTLVRNRDQLLRLPRADKRLLGVFSADHIPYAIDRRNDDSLAQIPDLPAMFAASLQQLQGSKDGFILQVEGGRVDHAGHSNDAGTILHEQLEFDACIPLALEFIEKNPDTMLIVTTDHGTGGCQLDGLGHQYLESGPALETINRIRHSFEWIEKRFLAAEKIDPNIVTHATGIVPSDEQVAAMQVALDDSDRWRFLADFTRIFGSELTGISSVGWSSQNHTAENVELLAFGPGSEQIPAFIRNYELFGIMTDALRI